ncbi:uncharacterized protein LOC126991913 [Eriocheir sinensis]|uniref:uncharacterized protein LOC126991913 n=1 Tax=Eriocheir sinensis TaxID=95602 RepID=UPI0021C71DBD|nr:uncharacterized protein LOC126991913 [Eriocheir sinensis]
MTDSSMPEMTRPALRHDLPAYIECPEEGKKRERKESGGTARHFLKKALLPLTGWCDSVGSLLLLDVTCDLPQGLDNGRIVRLNQTLEYGSLVEYHCLPEHRLVGGSFRRSCGELGEWLGGEPKCVLGPEDAYNTIGSDSSSSSSVSTTSTSTASNTGLYIGLFFGLILAIVFIGVLVYFRMFWAPRCTRELTVLASGQVAKMMVARAKELCPLHCLSRWPKDNLADGVQGRGWSQGTRALGIMGAGALGDWASVLRGRGILEWSVKRWHCRHFLKKALLTMTGWFDSLLLSGECKMSG